MKNSKSVKLAIIGTGGMANHHANKFKEIKGCKLVAACDIDPVRVRKFGDDHSIKLVFPDVASMLKGAEFDAVSIVTPDAFHAPITLQCIAAGKHVLCEKPLALNHGDAQEMALSANRAEVINMVNFSYRDWPCIQAAAALIKRGDIGEVRHVEASYLQAWLPSKIWGDWRSTPAWLWRLSTQHGSKGVLGDIGVHIVDYATFPCGEVKEVFCRLKAFSKGSALHNGDDKLDGPSGDSHGDYTLDANDSAVLSVEFANGALGTIHTSRWVGGHANRLALKIAGTKGTISMDSDISTTSFEICEGEGLDKCTWRKVDCEAVPSNYLRFVGAVRSGKPDQPDFTRGATVQRVLDACFESDAKRCSVRL